MEIVDYIKQFPLRKFKKGETLLSEGQHATRLFAIVSGFVKVTSILDNGSEKLLWIEGRYDIAPSEHLFSLGKELSFYYTALTDGSYYDIDKVAFLSFARKTPALMTEIAVTMSEHYDDLMKRINSVGQSSIRTKLISTLQYIAERFSAGDVVDLYDVGLKLTHNDFAGMVGSTRETVSIELHMLMEEGLIKYNRTSFIIYVARLQDTK